MERAFAHALCDPLGHRLSGVFSRVLGELHAGRTPPGHPNLVRVLGSFSRVNDNLLSSHSSIPRDSGGPCFCRAAGGHQSGPVAAIHGLGFRGPTRIQ